MFRDPLYCMGQMGHASISITLYINMYTCVHMRASRKSLLTVFNPKTKIRADAQKLIIKLFFYNLIKVFWYLNIALEAVDDCATVSLSMIVSLYELQKVMALVVCFEHCQVGCISPCTMYTHIFICKKLSVQVSHNQIWVFELYLCPLMKTLTYFMFLLCWNKINK